MAMVSFLSSNQVIDLLRSKGTISRQEAIDLYDRVLLTIDALQEDSVAINGVFTQARSLVEKQIAEST